MLFSAAKVLLLENSEMNIAKRAKVAERLEIDLFLRKRKSTDTTFW